MEKEPDSYHQAVGLLCLALFLNWFCFSKILRGHVIGVPQSPQNGYGAGGMQSSLFHIITITWSPHREPVIFTYLLAPSGRYLQLLLRSILLFSVLRSFVQSVRHPLQFLVGVAA